MIAVSLTWKLCTSAVDIRTCAEIKKIKIFFSPYLTEEQAISNWETGKTQPDIETLSNLAECFEVTVEELIYERTIQSGGVNVVIGKTTEKGIDSGVAVGIAMAVVISYTKWHSIAWAIFHGFLNWGYVIYYAIKY